MCQHAKFPFLFCVPKFCSCPETKSQKLIWGHKKQKKMERKKTKTENYAKVIFYAYAKMPPLGNRFEFWRAGSNRRPTPKLFVNRFRGFDFPKSGYLCR